MYRATFSSTIRISDFIDDCMREILTFDWTKIRTSDEIGVNMPRKMVVNGSYGIGDREYNQDYEEMFAGLVTYEDLDKAVYFGDIPHANFAWFGFTASSLYFRLINPSNFIQIQICRQMVSVGRSGAMRDHLRKVLPNCNGDRSAHYIISGGFIYHVYHGRQGLLGKAHAYGLDMVVNACALDVSYILSRV